jgi:protein-S-isoprenylcysteine O-methyltransferase Ste14
MGAWLFERRVRWMAAFFVAGLGMGAAAAGREGPLWATVWQLAGEPAPPRVTLLVTGLLCLLGFSLRTAGEARLGRAVLMQGQTARLLDDGLFARMRNPLYVGLWIFFVATCALWAPALALGGLALLFALLLHPLTLHEETLLTASLGEDYVRYLQRVPRWVPRLRASPPQGGVHNPGAAAWGSAVLGNLGLLSLGLYRVGVAAGADARVLGALNVVLLTVWLVVLAVRRFRGTRARA